MGGNSVTLLLVCLGGAIGSGARYLAGAAVPHGTLAVNLTGSFVMALTVGAMSAGDARIFVTTGILGGFTTYSAFNQETLELLRSGAWGSAAIHVLGTVIGCLLAGFVGWWLAATLLRK
ncbi:MAG TPA: CrcB family protein [Thermoanaerobaculia bacterium]|nr:CrcB family protein [Thermoanaerobaculia bacterium]